LIMSAAVSNLWHLIRATPRIDATVLARAVEDAADDAEDFRTQLLVRDSVEAIKALWGDRRTREWLSQSAHAAQIEHICGTMSHEALDEYGFPTIKRRIVDATDSETVRQFLRELSHHVVKPTRLIIGGSISLIIAGHLHRQTDDIDIVDEVPAEIRSQHQLLDDLAAQYGLQLAHFQSHYLPEGWDQRLHSMETFGQLQVFVVDAYDVFLTKLFSNRRKDKEDLRALLPHLDRETLRTRFSSTTSALRAEAKLRDAAEGNWYVLFGEKLPA
jgi:hypothetical protein